MWIGGVHVFSERWGEKKQIFFLKGRRENFEFLKFDLKSLFDEQL